MSTTQDTATESQKLRAAIAVMRANWPGLATTIAVLNEKATALEAAGRLGRDA